jgi:hypothetical protein
MRATFFLTLYDLLLIPREAAANAGRDLLIKRRLQVGILRVDLFEQIKVQRFDSFLKQSIEGQSFLFSEARDSHPRVIQSGVGVEDVLLDADSLLALHDFKSRLSAPLMLRIDHYRYPAILLSGG